MAIPYFCSFGFYCCWHLEEKMTPKKSPEQIAFEVMASLDVWENPDKSLKKIQKNIAAAIRAERSTDASKDTDVIVNAVWQKHKDALCGELNMMPSAAFVLVNALVRDALEMSRSEASGLVEALKEIIPLCEKIHTATAPANNQCPNCQIISKAKEALAKFKGERV